MKHVFLVCKNCNWTVEIRVSDIGQICMICQNCGTFPLTIKNKRE